jgi:RNA polymerase sigma factor (TIGR02999 family)
MITSEPIAELECSESSRYFAIAYDELRRIARRQRHRLGRSATLNTTALVHEAYIKLAPAESGLSRVHFFALAARAMRQILIDHARSHASLKRGGEISFEALDEEVAGAPCDMVEMLALDRTLTELTQLDARAGQMVEWHVFGGLSLMEIAELQSVALRTSYRDWRRARAFLTQRLGLMGVRDKH